MVRLRFRSILSIVFLFSILGALPVRVRASAAGKIPLQIAPGLRSSFPVSGGIPFPRGLLTSLDSLAVTDANGADVPAQFESLALWPDKSHKSVLVIFQASPGARYSLSYGGAKNSISGLELKDTAQSIQINTGILQFAVGKEKFDLFQNMKDSSGRQWTKEPADIFLVDAIDGTEYRASLGPRPEVRVEEDGPVRASVRVSGKLGSKDGRTLTDYIIRIFAYQGRDFVKMDYTLVDTREEKDVNAKRKELALSAVGYGFRLPLAFAPDMYGFGGEAGRATVHSGPLKKSVYLFQGGAMNHADGKLNPFSFGYEGAGRGNKATGWMDVSSKNQGMSVFFKDFWQQFPKELSYEEGAAVIHYHPKRASLPEADIRYPKPVPGERRYVRPNTFYFPREGGAKTYQVLFRFSPGMESEISADMINKTFQENPRVAASPEWIGRSGVFGRLIPAGPYSAQFDRHLMDNIYVPSVERFRRSGGLAMLYGWRDYGDRLRSGWCDERSGVKIPAFYNDTHIGAKLFFTQYIRTADERWWEIGEMATRHWMDIDVSHSGRRGYWKKGGKHVSFGPGEAHAIKHDVEDHSSPHLHPGHALVSGLPDYYLLTGDRRALEVLREVGDWWKNIAPVMFPVPVPSPHYAEAERDFAWPLYSLNEAFRATGDVAYLKAAAGIVRHLIEWWQTPSVHYVNGAPVGQNNWKEGTGWWAMYPKQDNSPDPPKGKTLYNGTNPWMAGPLLSAIIQFDEFNRDYKLEDSKLIREMLFQTMNYIVKYGYEESGRWKKYPYFVYSEAERKTDGGGSMIYFPLAYLGNLYRQGSSEHPERLDTAPKWLVIAQNNFQGWQRSKSRPTISEGFYGYEMILPADYWTLMVEQDRAAAPR